ncbi:MAG: hypothetical protein Q9O62_03425 [Ardenticatenia bacterium]|nr:hypothetical protein [Ardenticatenia bacterium]
MSRRISVNTPGLQNSSPEKKPYTKPAIIHEMRLEVHAGSPIRRPPDPLDLLGTGPG